MSTPIEPDFTLIETERVAGYLWRADAELARAVLHAEGIRVLLVDDSALGYNIDGYQIRVPAADAERARALIDEIRAEGAPVEPSTGAVRARQVLRYLLIAWFGAWGIFLVSALLQR